MQDKQIELKLGTGDLKRPTIPKLDMSVVWDWRHNIDKLITEHPGSCLAAAIGAGYLFGWWIKRK